MSSLQRRISAISTPPAMTVSTMYQRASETDQTSALTWFINHSVTAASAPASAPYTVAMSAGRSCAYHGSGVPRRSRSRPSAMAGAVATNRPSPHTT